MDRIDRYKAIAKQILSEYVASEPADEHTELVCVSDPAGGGYLLIELGWQPPRRIYQVIFHLRFVDGKLRIEQDWTEHGIARQLVEAGILADDIELMFQPPDIRHFVRLTPAE
jgi:hypothetical protein